MAEMGCKTRKVHLSNFPFICPSGWGVLICLFLYIVPLPVRHKYCHCLATNPDTGYINDLGLVLRVCRG